MRLFEVNIDGGGIYYWIAAPTLAQAMRYVSEAGDGFKEDDDAEEALVTIRREALTIHDTDRPELDGTTQTPERIVELFGPGIALCSEW